VKTIITLVYAQSRNGVIGAEGGLPWHIPSDLKRFKETTLGKPVIMGRKTWNSLPRKPLPGRKNIVLSRHAFSAEGAEWSKTPEAALALAGDVPEVCVIGGAEIYRLFLPLANRIYLTDVDIDVQGDAYAPELDTAQWQEVSRDGPHRGEKDSAAYTVRVLERAR
jgi:dihydrofolate reductase